MVIWTRPARADLRAIHDFIAQDSRHYAKKVAQEIREKSDQIEALPNAGRKVPELNDELVRETSIYSYRLIYEIKSNAVVVLAVVHKRRDLSEDDIER